ncbi:MAG: UDP-N-acetylmuramoyl-tripeptide--D-alanyl-D-alanine ligase, partial [Thermodesulfobacteriota bacterium]
MGFLLKDILEAIKGRLQEVDGAIGKEGTIKGVSIDSRTIVPGEIFFALKGARYDGHGYIAEALTRGASSVVVERPEAVRSSGVKEGGVKVVVVDDTLRALGDLAASLRERYPIPLLAVGGSTGKTTTKDMASLILGADGKEVLKTKGNMNNLIGLPLTLLDLDATFDFAVVELGISVAGEMERLAGISRPDVALLTNIGCGHIETLGDIEGVAMEKGELFGALSEEGVKIVNLDDPWTVRLADMDDEVKGSKCDRVTYSIEENADVSVSEVTEFGLDGTKVVYNVLGEDIEVRFNSPSIVNIQNGAAAIAGVLPLAASPEAMRQGLNSFMPESHRMVVINADGVTILDDTYNANPESVAVAVSTLNRAEGRKVA